MPIAPAVFTNSQIFGPFPTWAPNATLTYALNGGAIKLEVALGQEWIEIDSVTGETGVAEIRIAGTTLRIVPSDGAAFSFVV